MVYDLIYDKEGNIIDAILMQAGYGLEKSYVNTKIPTSTTIGNNISFGNSNHFLYYNSKLNTDYEDGVVEGSLNLTQITKEKIWNNISNNSKEYSILRFIQQDSNGNPILNYEGKKYDDTNHDSELINLSDKIKDRLKYSRLYIEKNVDKYIDNVVKTNDTLTYTISVKNNSRSDYNEDIIVSENISNYVIYKDYKVNKDSVTFSKDLENKKISWNIGKLNSGEEVIIEYTVTVKEKCYGQIIESTGTVGNISSTIIRNTISNELTKQQENSIKEKYDELKNKYEGKELINEIYKDSFGIDLKFDEFEITDLIKNTKPMSTTSTTISLNKNNIFYKYVLNKYWSTLYTKSYNYKEESDVIAYDLKYWREYTESERRSDTIYSENFKTGDILVYKNHNDVKYSYKNNILTTIPVTYENGEYVYIYIEGIGFVGVNYGDDGIAKTQDDRNEFKANYYSENGLKLYSNENVTDEKILEFANYQSLFGKDYYVILRPAMAIDILPMELSINYSSTELTNKDVTVTITSNEEMWNVEGWTISEDKKTLTKTYVENKIEELTIYDYSGNQKVIQIKIENIDKDKPKCKIQYSTTEITSEDVIVKIISNEIVRKLNGWELSSDKKELTKIYKNNTEEDVIILDEAGNSTTVKVSISNIDKNMNENNPNDENSPSNDNKPNNENLTDDTVIPEKELPKTGEKNILIGIVIIIIIGGYIFLKLNNYKEIK